MTYLVLSVIFLAAAALMAAGALIVARSSGRVARWWLPVALAGVVVLILTAVFDNLMISSGLMRYAAATLSGVYIGLAPLEDFAYPAAGAMLLPSLWFLFGKRDRDGR